MLHMVAFKQFINASLTTSTASEYLSTLEKSKDVRVNTRHARQHRNVQIFIQRLVFYDILNRKIQ